jgi:hypothetical protein
MSSEILPNTRARWMILWWSCPLNAWNEGGGYDESSLLDTEEEAAAWVRANQAEHADDPHFCNAGWTYVRVEWPAPPIVSVQ